MDRPAIPSGRSSQSFSFKNGRTKADEDRAPALAMQKDSMGLSKRGLRSSLLTGNPISSAYSTTIGPAKIDPRKISPPLMINWKAPSPVNRPSSLIRSGLRLNPSLNNKNRMPKSPSTMSCSLFSNTPNPYGPNTHPTKRKPRTGVIFNDLQRGTTNTLATRKTKTSRPSDASSAGGATTSVADDEDDNSCRASVASAKT
mmetsp:Transcript_304/g.795  ORF Transcript_304/g.795 Transcript_304/m.795 type:complete len:200 (-) Transcript_304:724-1323(-)